MSERPAQFSLRSLLIATAVIASLIGFLVWLPKAMREADRKAYRNAYTQGLITRESARDILGDEVDSIVPRIPEKPSSD